MKSTKFTLESKDFIKGLIIAILTPVFAIVTQSITTGGFVFDWKVIGGAALVGFMAYLTKNFFTDDTKEAVKTLSNQNVTLIEHSTGKNVTPANVSEIQDETKKTL